MTLDEAIAHCLEVAEQNEIDAITYKNCKEIKTNLYEKLTAEKVENDCRECAADHRQLAKWLTELKEAKRLLKAAVEDINFYVDCYEAHCDECCCDHDNHCHWKHEAEALKLIGGEEQ
jgi:hypothetical protein